MPARWGYLTAAAPILRAASRPAGDEPEMKILGRSASAMRRREAQFGDRVVPPFECDRLSGEQCCHDLCVLNRALVALVVRRVVGERQEVVAEASATMLRYNLRLCR